MPMYHGAGINDPSGCGERALLPDLAETLHGRFIAARITDYVG
jgi:hypothetical protein